MDGKSGAPARLKLVDKSIAKRRASGGEAGASRLAVAAGDENRGQPLEQETPLKKPLQLVEHRWDPDAVATLTAAGQGDPAATRALYRAHVGRVHRHVARILGPHDPDVEDVVQKVFLAALKGAHAFRGSSKVSTWILGIASRRALDEARSRWRRDRWNKIGSAIGVTVGGGRPASRPDERHAALSRAEALLQTLAPAQRQVFILKEVEGHTLKEIKEMTGVGISTLHARLKAARKRLDAAVEAERG